jgi:hypothetical protein
MTIPYSGEAIPIAEIVKRMPDAKGSDRADFLNIRASGGISADRHPERQETATRADINERQSNRQQMTPTSPSNLVVSWR